MIHFSRVLRLLAAALLLLALAVPAQAAGPKRMFASISTDDVNRAAMAISFTHAAMKQKQVEGILFFNVYGVRLVNGGVPSPVYPDGKSIRQMLEAFQKDGGIVMACPMCMKNIGGMTQADLLPGVVAKAGAGVDAATAPDTLVLSY